MLDIGWPEILTIAAIALIIIGPKDLPKVLKTLGQWVAKIRGMAREFQKSIDEVVRDAELDEVRDQFKGVKNFDINKSVSETLDPEGDLDNAFKVEDPDAWKKGKPDAKAPVEEASVEHHEIDVDYDSNEPAEPAVAPQPGSAPAAASSAGTAGTTGGGGAGQQAGASGADSDKKG